MKIQRFLLVCFLAAGATIVAAQDFDAANKQAGVSVLSQSWSYREFTSLRIQRGSLETRRNLPDVYGGESAPQTMVRSEFFVYETRFKNNTGRKIRGLTFDYVFSDRVTGEILKRHKFNYLKRIGRGNEQLVKANSVSPPTNKIDVASLEKNAVSPYRETTEIRCVLFDDDSLWKSGSATDAECAELKRLIEALDEIRKRI